MDRGLETWYYVYCTEGVAEECLGQFEGGAPRSLEGG
jgi:hypothetical protein